jgi:hypothetical protein
VKILLIIVYRRRHLEIACSGPAFIVGGIFAYATPFEIIVIAITIKR